MLMIAPNGNQVAPSVLTKNVKFEFCDDHLKRSWVLPGIMPHPKILGEEGFRVL